MFKHLAVYLLTAALHITATAAYADDGLEWPDWKNFAHCDPNARVQPNQRFNVVSYNIKSGQGGPRGIDGIVDALRGIQFDAILLQEVDFNSVRSRFVDQAGRIAKRLGLCGTYYASINLWAVQTYGNAILSRYPITDFDAVKLPRALISVGKEPRSILRISLKSSSTSALHLVVTHLSLAESDRLREATFIKSRFAYLRNQSVIFAGDLNDFTGSRAMRKLIERPTNGGFYLDEAITRLGIAPVPTYPAQMPTRAIDHFLVHGGVIPLSLQSVHVSGSDHLPLRMQTELRLSGGNAR